LVSRIKEARILVKAITYSLRDQLYESKENAKSLLNAIRNDPNIKDRLTELNIEMGLDSYGRSWIYCPEANIYYYINKHSKKIRSGTAEDLIKACSINRLVRLIEVFIDYDNLLEEIKNELLRKAKKAEIKSALNPLIAALSDPNPMIRRSIKEARILVAVIAYSLRQQLDGPKKNIKLLLNNIKKNPHLKDRLIKLNIRMGFDSLGDHWIYCPEADFYLYVNRNKKKIVLSTAKGLIKACSINGLVRLVEVFIDDDGLLKEIEKEFLRKAKKAGIKSALNPLIAALSDPDEKYIEFIQKLILKIPKSTRDEKDAFNAFIVGALANKLRREAAIWIILEALETDPEAIIERLGKALSKPECTKYVKELLLEISETSNKNAGLVIWVTKIAQKKGNNKLVAKATEEILTLLSHKVVSQHKKEKRHPKSKKPRPPKKRTKGIGEYNRNEQRRYLRELKASL